MKLKGTTTIELTDVNTGEVTVVEDTNFVTNAYHDMCQPILRNHDTMHGVVSTHTNRVSFNELMSGLLMFDTALENNPDKYFPPANVNMVGHGAEIIYTGSDLTLGSFNNNLSDTSSTNKRTFVWDFTAEQGNGTIASVCLTTIEGGLIGYGTPTTCESSSSYQRLFSNFMKSQILTYYPSSMTYNMPVYLSFKDDYILVINLNTVYSGSLTFYKYHLWTKKEDIFKTAPAISGINNSMRAYTLVGSGYTDYESIGVDLRDIIGSSGGIGMAQDGKYLYIARNTSTSSCWAINSKIKVVKLNLETLSYESFDVINTTGETTNIFNKSSTSFYQGYSFGICNGYMFVVSSSANYGRNKGKIYAINLEDNTVVKKVTLEDGTDYIAYAVRNNNNDISVPFTPTLQGKVALAIDTNHYVNASSRELDTTRCISTDDFILKALGVPTWALGGTSFSSGSFGFMIFPTDNDLYLGYMNSHNIYNSQSSCDVAICFYPNVLMTINNLDTPVTKTPSQTMRITYTLTKEE